jgi:hypothetical protein
MSELQIIGPGGTSISTVDEWFAHAPPKRGIVQWKDRRSAKELARAWVGTGTPIQPTVIAEALDAQPETRGYVAGRGFPEHKTVLDELAGETRNHDLLLVGEAGGRKTVVGVEAKADETFGETIGIYLGKVAGRQGSKAPARIRSLVQAIFGADQLLPDGSVGSPISSLRYQLLHATAATVIEARAHGAVQAVLLVHQFLSASTEGSAGTDPAKVAHNDEDLHSFVAALRAPDPTGANWVTGPIAVPGHRRVPAFDGLFIAKATSWPAGPG